MDLNSTSFVFAQPRENGYVAAAHILTYIRESLRFQVYSHDIRAQRV